MALAIFSFIAAFALLASGGLLLFYRQRMLQRISLVITAEHSRTPLLNTVQQTRSSVIGMIGNLDRFVPKSAGKRTAIAVRLTRAGYRSSSAIRTFYGAKAATPILLLALAAVSGLMSVAAWLISCGIGFILPELWLAQRVRARQKELRRGLPDALDFLVICIEAGLSMDQATARTAEELKLAYPALSDELEVLVLEQRAGRPRSDAWQQFAERTGVEAVRTLATVLVQAEQLGTGISKTLRVHSEAMRTERRQTIEEQAAKTSVKLVFPLVLFIFPSLFLVTLGPEAIQMAEAFQSYFPH